MSGNVISTSVIQTNPQTPLINEQEDNSLRRRMDRCYNSAKNCILGTLFVSFAVTLTTRALACKNLSCDGDDADVNKYLAPFDAATFISLFIITAKVLGDRYYRN